MYGAILICTHVGAHVYTRGEHGEHYMVHTMEFLQDFLYRMSLFGMLKRVSWQITSIWIPGGIIHVNRVSTEKGNGPEPNDVEL